MHLDGIKKRSVLHSPHLVEIKKKKRKIVKNKILFISFCILVIILTLVFVSRIKSINITSVEVSGNKIIEADQIESVVRDSITGHYAWVIPKTNFLLYPQNTIKKNLTDKFKRIKEVNISQKNPQILEVKITERGIEYTYCGVAPNTETEKCYFLDQNGYIFDQAPNFSGNVYFKFYGKVEGNAQSPIGSFFLAEKFKEVENFNEKLEQMGLAPTSLLLKDDGDVEMYLGNKETSTAPKIVFKSNADFIKLSENLRSAINIEPLSKNLKEKLGDLLYIDLRFGNKVYYKFK